MTPTDFCYWLQGFFEITGAEEVTKEQVEVVKNHLNLVFHHSIDPTYGDKEHQAELQEVHDGKAPKKTFPRPPKSLYPPSTSGLTKFRC